MDAVSPILEARNISKSFGGVSALASVSFTAGQGTITTLVGPNGAGKTTLFNIISGVMPADGGDIFFIGHRINSLPNYRIARLGIARTFQHPRVFPNMTVLENVMLITSSANREYSYNAFQMAFLKGEVAQEKSRALETLDVVNLEKYRDQFAGNLSFGSQRLLNIAQVLAGGAELILMDEPTSGLHPEEMSKLFPILRNLVKRQKKTILLVEHDMSVVNQLADMVYFLYDGRILVSGSPDQVLHNEKVLEAYLGKCRL